MLNDKDPRMRRNVTAALVRIGLPAVPHLIKVLSEGDSIMRRNAAVILGSIGPKAKDAIPALERGLRDKDKAFCWTVKQALRKIHQTSFHDLVDSLDNKDVIVRINAAQELGDMGEKAADAVPALIKCLDDDKAEVRKNAAYALAKIGKPAVPALLDVLKHKDPTIRKNTVFTLGEMGADAKDALAALTELYENDQDKDVRICAEHAIKKIQQN